MKIIAYDNFKPGVTLEDLKPYLRDEVSNVWRLWKAGVVRENYARADVGGFDPAVDVAEPFDRTKDGENFEASAK
jgi:hypothetical protein